MQIDGLKILGLTDGEIKVYNAILSIGIATINRIHEKTGLERRSIYDIINKLIEKGLVSYMTEDKKKTYQCAPPNRLLQEIKKRKEELEKFEEQIPDITKIYNTSKPSINAEIYRGKEGLKNLWEEMLNYREVRWLGSGRYVPKQMPHFFIPWNKRRIEKKSKWFNIFRHELKKEVTPMEYEEVRFLPKEFSGNPTVLGVYGNKVVNLIFGDEIFIFVIESKELAENYKAYHKYLWENVATK